DALVQKLLSRKPDDRPNAAEVARALAQFEDEPVVSSLVASAVSPSILSSSKEDPRALATGSRLGKFTIESKLGAGGMGAVFQAKTPEGKLVALKIVAHGLDTDSTKRFAREARALAEP